MQKELDKIVLSDSTLVVLCGIAGCGKSTFAAKHFLPTQIVSSDDCRARICDDATNQKVTGHAFELWRLIIRKRLQLGRFTVADATNLEHGDRLWLVKTARYYNIFPAVIVFDIRLETCLARNAARDRVVPEEALIKQYELLQDAFHLIPTEDFSDIFTLDETTQSQIEVETASTAN